MRLLLDENISPLTASFLEEMGHDVVLVRDLMKGSEDRKVVETALEEERAILTQDTDFGEIYYFANPESLKVVVVKPPKQTVESLNSIISDHLPAIEEYGFGLFILEKGRIRRRR